MEIIFSKRFLKDAKKLKKKYKNLEKDLMGFVDSLESGKSFGDRLQGFAGFAIYKARIKNSSVGTGKSGGFRAIYYAKHEALIYFITIYFITIYSKSNKENVDSREIYEILKEEGLS